MPRKKITKATKKARTRKQAKPAKPETRDVVVEVSEDQQHALELVEEIARRQAMGIGAMRQRLAAQIKGMEAEINKQTQALGEQRVKSLLRVAAASGSELADDGRIMPIAVDLEARTITFRVSDAPPAEAEAA